MIGLGWCRTSVNWQIGRIKQMFKWCASRELVPVSVHQGLTTLAGLRAGRSDATEADPVKPVADEIVVATLPHLSSTVRAMVQAQLYTGARPGEICCMRIGDIDRSADTWTYTPATHKTAHHGKSRVIYIGKRAQVVLSPFTMKLDPTAFLFSPAEAVAEMRQRRSAARKTPLSCGNRPGANRNRRHGRTAGQCYNVAAYRRAIARACDDAFPSPAGMTDATELAAWRSSHRWHPHQLRHTAATLIRKQFGIEAAQHVLGHASLQMAEVYAEKNAEVAKRVAAVIG
jgi:integrase